MKATILVCAAVSMIAATSATAAAPEDDSGLSTGAMIDRLDPQRNANLRIAPGTRGFAVKPRLMLQAVTFEFDSATLTSTAIGVLERVAAALSSPRLSEARFLIEGHTDAVGDRSYNQHLSQRRAGAVQQFLNSLGVESLRMEVLGKGEDELLEDEPPNSAHNRRVEIVRLPVE